MENLHEYLPQSVEGKAVLITGGTTGIGRAIAVLLARLGARVMIFGHRQDHLDDALADIKATAATDVYGYVIDVVKEEDIACMFREVDAKLKTLDVLINNVAMGYGNVTEGEYKDWQRVVNVNLTSYLAFCAGAIARMQANGSGHIINIGSMSANRREETGSVYVATKAAIQAYSEALRKEVNKRGIKVTLIEPGAVDTDMQQQPTTQKLEKVESLEMLTAQDVAVAVLYCLSQPKRCDVVELKVRPHLQLI
ncbi:SDR family NAD(P)-dependent oxidoreductase [Flavobacterium sp. Sd200]|uniref:SDR family oxidoreductase n=1 Tax=Flavobacterium sp. Sd200 TaxID=2692211 RepID=UPI00136857A1|nr:SDR family oxidoreductase [Flavobacterium sp. Sd200]MXN92075.1 SDR family NAD(P)-dependent oxidoreductase [Flavobacterium sp. Sd200]